MPATNQPTASHPKALCRKRSPCERSDIRGSSLLNPMTLIEIKGVAQDSGHVANLD